MDSNKCLEERSLKYFSIKSFVAFVIFSTASSGFDTVFRSLNGGLVVLVTYFPHELGGLSWN